jgi:hypothetical protein
MTTAEKEEEAAARLEALARLQHQYDETKNPLYAWEAIVCCLLADNPLTIPDWCLNYLRETAANIYRLSCGRDFRHPESKLSTDRAFELVAEALSLSKQGKRNAFAALLKDQDDQRDINSVMFYGEGMFEQIAERRNVTKDRAKRIVAARGKSLLRQSLRRKTVKPHP